MKIVDMTMQLMVSEQGLVMLAVSSSEVLPLGNIKTGDIYLARKAKYTDSHIETYTGWTLKKDPDVDMSPETVARVALNYNLNLAQRNQLTEAEALEEAYNNTLASFGGQSLGTFLGAAIEISANYRNGQAAPAEAASLALMVLSAVAPALSKMALAEPLLPTMQHAVDTEPSIFVPGNDTRQ